MKKIRKFDLFSDYNLSDKSNPQLSHVLENDYVYIDSKTIPLGIFILGKDGKYYRENEWNQDNSNAIGISVANEVFKFGISKNDSYASWGTFDKLISNCKTTIEDLDALSDSDGFNNTKSIIEQDSPNCMAAIFCDNESKKIGKECYLGSIGEWNFAFENKAQIEKLMNKIGGQKFSTYYWSSTQYDSQQSWNFIWVDGIIDIFYKDDKRFVRPFIKL